MGLNLVQLQRLFMKIHNAALEMDNPLVRRSHPHGLGVAVLEAEILGKPPMHLVIPAHKSPRHADRTVSDLFESIRSLGGPIVDFKIVAVGD